MMFRGISVGWRNGLTAKFIKFKKANAMILYLRRKRCNYSLGIKWLKSSFAERDQKVLVDEKGRVTWHQTLAAMKTNCTLCSISKNVVSSLREYYSLPFVTC